MPFIVEVRVQFQASPRRILLGTVALGKGFLREIRVFPVAGIPLFHSTRITYAYHRRYNILTLPIAVK
jgi:hypothetical protein